MNYSQLLVTFFFVQPSSLSKNLPSIFTNLEALLLFLLAQTVSAFLLSLATCLLYNSFYYLRGFYMVKMKKSKTLHFSLLLVTYLYLIVQLENIA